MIEYAIIHPIVLGFLGQFYTNDRIISPGDGYLQFDNKNIIFVDNNGIEHKSITTNNAISIWLEQNYLELRV